MAKISDFIFRTYIYYVFFRYTKGVMKL